MKKILQTNHLTKKSLTNSNNDGSNAPNITWVSYNGTEIVPVPLKPQKNDSKENNKEAPNKQANKEMKNSSKSKFKGHSSKAQAPADAKAHQDMHSSNDPSISLSGAAPNITWVSYNGTAIVPVPAENTKNKEKSPKKHSSKSFTKKPSKKDVVQKVKLLTKKHNTKATKKNHLKHLISKAKKHGKWKKKSTKSKPPRKAHKTLLKHGKQKKSAKRKHVAPHNDEDDYDHSHPMGGHRYGDSEFDAIHANANHEQPKNTHYNLHDNMQENHDEQDLWSDRYPPQGGDPLAGNDNQKKSFVESRSDLMFGNSYFAKKTHLPGGAHTCVPGLTLRGATLRGGVMSGDFKSMGVVETQKKCIHLCCKSKDCDVAMTVGRECINIRCFDKNTCAIAPAGQLYHTTPPVATFVQHVPVKGDEMFSKRSNIPSYPFTKEALLDEVDSTDQSIDLQEILNEVDKLGW